MLRDFWAAPNLATRPGLKAIDLFQAIADKTVRAIWIIGTNPAISLPDGAAVRAALAGCDLVVISENAAGSDTADLAHVRLARLGLGGEGRHRHQ